MNWCHHPVALWLDNPSLAELGCSLSSIRCRFLETSVDSDRLSRLVLIIMNSSTRDVVYYADHCLIQIVST
jgi:hypothetical protein